MVGWLSDYFTNHPLDRIARDALDIVIVYYITYRALLVLRGTRAMQVAIGLGAVFLLYVVAQKLQLISLVTILGALISSIILVIVVVFQNDLRRALMRVGSQASFAAMSERRESRVIDEVVSAATELARHRIGAIIAFEQEANLDEFVGSNKGKVVDAAVTADLLVALFVPEGVNKLHDGAVLIRNLRIAKAGVFFPMPDHRTMDQSFGTRHRAAVGITDETDAVVVVVSEERGTISFCFNGNIASNLDGPKLLELLDATFRKAKKKPAKKPDRARTTRPVTLPARLTLNQPIRPTTTTSGRPKTLDGETEGPLSQRGAALNDGDALERLDVAASAVVLTPPSDPGPTLSQEDRIAMAALRRSLSGPLPPFDDEPPSSVIPSPLRSVRRPGQLTQAGPVDAAPASTRTSVLPPAPIPAAAPAATAARVTLHGAEPAPPPLRPGPRPEVAVAPIPSVPMPRATLDRPAPRPPQPSHPGLDAGPPSGEEAPPTSRRIP